MRLIEASENLRMRRRAIDVILDTHILFDWVVFRNPAIAELQRGVECGALRWLGTADMLAEARHVVERGALARWQPDVRALEEVWRQWVVQLDAPGAALAGLRCRDPNDQMFIDLAALHRPRWLLSRDRAVLALRRPLSRLGVAVLTPEAWARGWPAELAAPAGGACLTTGGCDLPEA